MNSSQKPTSQKSTSEKPTAQIGVTGLAVMGSNIARNFARHGYTVALHNRSVAKTDALLAEHGSDGKFVRSESIEEFLAAHNDDPKPFAWTKSADEILASIARFATRTVAASDGSR